MDVLVAAETPPLVHPPTPAAVLPARTALATLADATYFRAALDPDTAASLFTACVDLPLDAARSGRGPRSHTYRGAEAALMPLPLAAAAAQLVAIGALKRPPTMISVNHYDDAIYEMLPHKDGFVEQAAVLSLNSDCALSFWRVPMTDRERAAREAYRTLWSGTEVYEHLVATAPGSTSSTRDADCRCWLEPGSVLLLEGSALEDWAHGVVARESERFDGAPPIANENCVDVAALRRRCGNNGGGVIRMARRPRVSVVMWTTMRASPLATALAENVDDATAVKMLAAALAAATTTERGRAELVVALRTVGARGFTPLGCAVGRGDDAGGVPCKLVEMLLDAGASPDGVRVLDEALREEEVDEEKETPLTRCAAVRAAATAALLLERGADCERCDVRGRSPLTAAAEAGAVGVVKELLAAGAEAGRLDGRGESAVGIAAANGRDAVVGVLLGALEMEG